jgi:poly(3-hydroxybutyrate) depolymerase
MNFVKARILIFLLLLVSCNRDNNPGDADQNPAYQITKNIYHHGISVDLVIDKPEGNDFDVLMVFHGTVRYDSLILQAFHNVL